MTSLHLASKNRFFDETSNIHPSMIFNAPDELFERMDYEIFFMNISEVGLFY